MEQRTTGEMSVGVGDCLLPRGLHICGLFDDDDERIRTLARFCRAGDGDHDKFLYIVDTASPEELADCFAAHGADLGPGSHADVIPSAKGSRVRAARARWGGLSTRARAPAG